MTGIVVTYNTKELFEIAYNSIRKFMPKLKIIIVDGSDPGDPCYDYVKSLESDLTEIYQHGRNIGHGPGMHKGISMTDDELLLMFDSDIEMLKNPIPNMVYSMGDRTYAIGEMYTIGRDGLHRNPVRNVPYVRPYFMILSRYHYYRYPPFVHHGSPCILPMLEIFNLGLSETVLTDFDLTDFVKHDFAGTRKVNVASGKREIPLQWTRIPK